MNRVLIAAASLLATVATIAAVPAHADTLSTGTGEGAVTVDVNGFGGMGTGNGVYDPIGPIAAASTIYASGLFYRQGTDGGRIAIDTGSANLVSYAGTSSGRVSVFTLNGTDLSVTLTQTVGTLVDTAGNQTGSQLVQSYAFTNGGATSTVLDLVRYLDGDLAFDGSNVDGGGMQVSNGTRVLFEIDSATGAATSSTFVGIYNSGAGTESGYLLRDYNGAISYLRGGGLLGNVVQNDVDGDGFVDTGYDVTLNLGRTLNLGAGATQTFTTTTLFGTGLPGQVSVPGAVPEPATWATFILGFGAIGRALRRKGRGVAALA